MGTISQVGSKWKRLSVIKGTREAGLSSSACGGKATRQNGRSTDNPTRITKAGWIPTDEAIRWQSLRSSPRTGKPSTWQRGTDWFVLSNRKVQIWRVPNEHRRSSKKTLGTIEDTQREPGSEFASLSNEYVRFTYPKSLRPDSSPELAESPSHSNRYLPASPFIFCIVQRLPYFLSFFMLLSTFFLFL